MSLLTATGKNIYNLLANKVPPKCEVFVNACSGAPLNHVLNNAHSMTEKFMNDDTVVIIAGANDLSDITPRYNRPARLRVDQVKRFLMKHYHTNFIVVSMFHRHHDHWNSFANREVRRINMELQESLEELGGAMVDVTRFGRRLFKLQGQHLNVFGKRVLCGMIAASARRLRISTIRRPAFVLDMQVLPDVSDYAPSMTASTSNLQKDDAHQISSSPINLQLVSYADAVKSPPRTVSRPSTEESARGRDTDVAETVDAPSNYRLFISPDDIYLRYRHFTLWIRVIMFLIPKLF
ncbi:hypothetical protein J6590_061314 [Homalodisca vitripennis]|nr:hypothetical protein J6590_061314 [Homalodisca vitripennis]